MTFSAGVNFANGGAAAGFRLTNLDTGASVDLTTTVSTEGSGRTAVTLTFDFNEIYGAPASEHGPTKTTS